jgi:hypothetical protein
VFRIMTVESIKRFEEVQAQVARPTENMIRVSTRSPSPR